MAHLAISPETYFSSTNTTAEDVGRVVLGLERHQPCVVRAVGAQGPLLALVAQVVHIHRARQVRRLRREQLAGPANVARRIGWVGPDGQGDGVVLQVAMVIGRVRFAHSAVGAVELSELAGRSSSPRRLFLNSSTVVPDSIVPLPSNVATFILTTVAPLSSQVLRQNGLSRRVESWRTHGRRRRDR